jgi:hypothetical protein
MIADVADALHHAHQNGVTHRDIKPSNLLLSADGRLSVTDFGLARMLELPGMTITGEFVGTPAYMSPEQITAGRVPVDHRADVYSLGATLYELLVLRPPFVAEGRDQLLALVTQKDPTAPRAVDPKVPRDLETICLKCLEKDPDRRYPTAAALAEDLRRYVRRFAISARRAGPLTRAKKWVRRNPALAAAGAAVVLAAATTGYFAWQVRANERQRVADERRRDAEQSAERRRATVERGMAAALAADLPAAERAVAEAELLGASPGETRFLRGFIAVYAGRSVEALAHLEQAARLMPESVSARALLAYAHAGVSDWTSARRVVAEALTLTPRTPEDKLFLGQAIGELEPARGLPLMDEALAEHPSGIGHVLRAGVRATLATDTGSMADADAAVVDAELAKRLLPGHPFAVGVAAFARLAAAAACRYAGRPRQADEHLAAANREAEELGRFRGNYDAVSTRFCVAIIRDGLDGRMDRLSELHEARAAAPAAGLAYLEAYNLYCLGRNAEAAAAADPFPDDRQVAYVRVLLALGRPGGRADARRAWERVGGPGHPLTLRLEAAPVLFAVADPGEREAAAREIRAELPRLGPTTYSPTEPANLLAFLDGSSGEAEFLARPAANPAERCRRSFWVGWSRLGSGDRAGAKAAFQTAYEILLVRYQFFWVSRAVLIRMKDPDWPQAIPKD